MEQSKIEIRPSKLLYFLDVARATAMRSSCINTHWGAIIVKDENIISTGYNGAPRGTVNCCELGQCCKEINDNLYGADSLHCGSIHAEMNAIINASRRDMIGSSMFVYAMDVQTGRLIPDLSSCVLCKRMIINAGINEVVYADINGLCFDRNLGYGYRVQKVSKWSFDDILLIEPGTGY